MHKYVDSQPSTFGTTTPLLSSGKVSATSGLLMTGKSSSGRGPLWTQARNLASASRTAVSTSDSSTFSCDTSIVLFTLLSTFILSNFSWFTALTTQAQEPCKHGRRLAASRACCVVHRHRYLRRRCQCQCQCQCQCLRQLHPSSPTQQFRVLVIPRQMPRTQNDRSTAVSRSTLLVFALVLSSVPIVCSWRISVGFFSKRLASPSPLSHGAREVAPTSISTSPSLPQASIRAAASGRQRLIPCPT